MSADLPEMLQSLDCARDSGHHRARRGPGSGSGMAAPLTLAAALLLAVVAGAAACGGRAPTTVVAHRPLPDDAILYHIDRIDRARRTGALEPLRREYEDRLAQAPDDPDALFLAARVQGDPNAAFKLHQQALALAPDGYWPNLGLGESYLRLGILQRAEESLQRTLRIDAGLPFAHAALGELYRQKNQRKEAIAAFDRAIQLDSGCYPAHRGLASIYLASGNRGGARRELEQAVALAPGDFEMQLELAALLAGEGETEQAAAAYQRATALNANNVRAWTGRAATARALDRRDEAIRALERVLELQSSNEQARRELAALLRERGDLDRADQLYRDLAAANPEDLETRRGQAQLFEAQGRLAEAMLAYRELASRDPQDEGSKARLVELRQRIGAGEQAVGGRTLQQVFDRALQAILGCHRRLGARGSQPGGELVAEVQIGDDGRASDLQILDDTTGSVELRECLIWVVRNAAFPPGQAATVMFPVEF